MNALAPRAPEAPICITSPSTAREWSQARSLVKELFRWIQVESGVAMSDVQDGADAEIDALPWLYVPPKGSFVIASADGEVLGTTGVSMLEPDIAELKRVYVKPSARGLGLAPRMLEAAIGEARQLGATRLVLETHREIMSSAVRMYRRRGFTEIADYTDLPSQVPGVIAMGLRLDA